MKRCGLGQTALVAEPPNRNFGRVLNIVADIAPIAVMIKGKPGFWGWLAIAASAGNIVARLRATVREDRHPWAHFKLNTPATSPWLLFPGYLIPLVKSSFADVRPVAGNENAALAYEASFDGLHIGWIEENNQVTFGLCRKEDEDVFSQYISDALWARIACSRARIGLTGIEPDDTPAENVIETKSITSLGERVQRFLPYGTRTYLLVGAPGTGKSTMINHVARQTGLRTLRVQTTDVSTGLDRPRYSGEESLFLHALISAVRPDVLIIDDVDRAMHTEQMELLRFLDSARHKIKVLLATANDSSKLIKPLQRPERFDDVIEVGAPDRQVIEQLLGPNADLAHRMTTWPIAYILDFVRRAEVLGSAAARAELDGLERRLHQPEEEDLETLIAARIGGVR